MLISKTISEVKTQLQSAKNLGKKIAFIPTMGALHEGHLALIRKGQELAEIVLVSIFVNKAQFNDSSDYEKYPRQVEDDLAKLKNSGVTHVFLPQDSEIFAEDFSLKITPTQLVDCLCGAFRPGHFDGVALIVAKLFNIIKPDIAIFGQKDFQQLLVIKKLVTDLNFDVEIFPHEIVREKDGLAMSSRNQRLSEGNKIKAANIFRILSEVKNEVKKDAENYKKILQKKHEELLKIGFEKIDYLEIRDEKNLQLFDPRNFTPNNKFRILIAVYLGGIRLIDNLQLTISD